MLREKKIHCHNLLCSKNEKNSAKAKFFENFLNSTGPYTIGTSLFEKISKIKPKYDELRTTSNLIGRTSKSFEPRFIHQNRTFNPFEPLQKAQTSNLFGQKQAEPRPKSGKTKLRTFPSPGSSNKTELQTYTNPPKILNFNSTNWV